MSQAKDWVPNFPQELKDIPQWCVWKLLAQDGRLAKVPLQPDSRFKAMCDDPKTWVSFPDACRALTSAPNEHGGLGFQLGLSSCDYIFVDLDACRRPDTGELAPWAQIFLQRHPTYVEITPSSTGLRAIYRGTCQLPNGRGIQDWRLADMAGFNFEKQAQIEVFLHHKYVAVTGNLLGALRPVQPFLGDLPAELDQLSKDYPARERTGTAKQDGLAGNCRYAPELSSEEKLERLRAGDWESLGYASPSHADLAFCTLVARQHLRAGATEPELSAIIDDELRASALYRKKWDRKTYRDLTIPRAIKSAVAMVNHPSGKDISTVRKLDISPITDHPMQPVSWLWLNRIPLGKVVIFAGHMDTGKTNVALDVIARATTGRDWPDGATNTTPPCNALILPAEDSVADTIRPRLVAAGADEARIQIIKSTLLEKADATGAITVESVITTLDKDCQLLREALKSRPNTKIVLIDPITSYLGRAKFTDEQRVRDCMYPVTEMAQELGVLVMAITHLNRTIGLGAKQKTLGAGLDKVSRAVWGFADDRAKGPGHYAMVRIKKNVGCPVSGLTYELDEVVVDSGDQPITAPRVKWTGETNLNMDDLLRQEDGGAAKQRHAVGWLASTISGKGGKASAAVLYAAAESVGIERQQLSEARKYLGVKSYCGRDGKSWWKFVVGKATSLSTPVGTKDGTASGSTEASGKECLFDDEDDSSCDDAPEATL